MKLKNNLKFYNQGENEIYSDKDDIQKRSKERNILNSIHFLNLRTIHILKFKINLYKINILFI